MIKAAIFDMYETLITLFGTPVYFGPQIAEDLHIESTRFLSTWDKMSNDRSIGKISFEEALIIIMNENNCYDSKSLKKVVDKRENIKKDSFKYLHPEIIQMLTELNKNDSILVMAEVLNWSLQKRLV